jgi:hypothetical protein
MAMPTSLGGLMAPMTTCGNAMNSPLYAIQKRNRRTTVELPR